MCIWSEKKQCSQEEGSFRYRDGGGSSPRSRRHETKKKKKKGKRLNVSAHYADRTFNKRTVIKDVDIYYLGGFFFFLHD